MFLGLFKKNKKAEEHANHERWLVSYADFMTLLFAFFTVMYATSEQDVKKAQEFENSVQKYMKVGAMGESGHKISQGRLKNAVINSPVKKHQNKNAVKIQSKVESLIESNMTVDEIKKSIRDVSEEYAGVKISLAADTLFEVNSLTMKDSSIKILKRMGEILTSTQRNVYIVAHTDDGKIKAAGVSNHLELGSLQASLIAKHFIDVYNINPKKIVPLSYGSTRPVDVNTHEKGRSKNRRIDILILDDGLPL